MICKIIKKLRRFFIGWGSIKSLKYRKVIRIQIKNICSSVKEITRNFGYKDILDIWIFSGPDETKICNIFECTKL